MTDEMMATILLLDARRGLYRVGRQKAGNSPENKAL